MFIENEEITLVYGPLSSPVVKKNYNAVVYLRN